MFPLNFPPRLIASFLHFCISLVIISILVGIVIFFWFPPPFFTTAGGWQGLKIVILVDLIIGPVLTLIAFSPTKTKKALYFDLSIIFLMQVSALIWGIYNIYYERPAAVVFWDNNFLTVPHRVLVNQKVDLNQYGNNLPVYIFAESPKSEVELKKMSQRIKTYKRPPHHQVELYKNIEDHFDDIFKYNLNIEEIIEKNNEMRKQLEELLLINKIQFSSRHHLKYIALKSKYQNIILIYKDSKEMIGYIKAPYKKNL